MKNYLIRSSNYVRKIVQNRNIRHLDKVVQLIQRIQVNVSHTLVMENNHQLLLYSINNSILYMYI